MNKVMVYTVFASIFGLFACIKGADSPNGFSLPVGDSELGRQVFLKHGCLQCHSILGESDKLVTREREPPIQLGANSAIVKTYAQLVTSIINPSHRIARSANWETSDKDGKSIMRNYNDVMTVSELIDVVTYLQQHYKVSPLHIPDYASYKILQEDTAKIP